MWFVSGRNVLGKKIISLKGIYFKVGLGLFEGECYSDIN